MTANFSTFEGKKEDGSGKYSSWIIIEQYQDNYQINAFEFKLSDIKKVLLQAEANIPFCNKSWIVLPDEKTNLIKDRYLMQLKKLKYKWRRKESLLRFIAAAHPGTGRVWQ